MTFAASIKILLVTPPHHGNKKYLWPARYSNFLFYEKIQKSAFWIFDRFKMIFWRFWEKNIYIYIILFFLKISFLWKSLKIKQKWCFWHKRTSETWFSWRNHPDWYRRNRFSIHGDPFYDFLDGFSICLCKIIGFYWGSWNGGANGRRVSAICL